MSRRRSQKRVRAYQDRLAGLPAIVRAMLPDGRPRRRPKRGVTRYGLSAKEYAHRKRRRQIARASRQRNRRGRRG